MCAERLFSETPIVERVGNTIVPFVQSYLSLAPDHPTRYHTNEHRVTFLHLNASSVDTAFLQ